ncbi:hypothetical protein [uncultured Microbacterium sp.]|uniref:hypothetical protein n=1 Tax=uncultured Microbacterium sp. TaxID=191216 RepID=UPI0028DCA111|nr:hypothetical protein [uncultured Microbacterium sp.]
MDAAVIDAPAPARTGEPWYLRRRLILLASVVVVPVALTAALNSYGPLTEESALRMAFATVAGMTAAVLGAVAALVVTLARRRSIPGVIFFALVLVFVTTWALAAVSGAGDLLLERLALIDDVAGPG